MAKGSPRKAGSRIRAENPGDAGRLIEADRAIDEIQVVRKALANAVRAQRMAHVGTARMILTEYVMMEGECPDLERANRVIDDPDADYRLSVEETSGSRL